MGYGTFLNVKFVQSFYDIFISNSLVRDIDLINRRVFTSVANIIPKSLIFELFWDS